MTDRMEKLAEIFDAIYLREGDLTIQAALDAVEKWLPKNEPAREENEECECECHNTIKHLFSSNRLQHGECCQHSEDHGLLVEVSHNPQKKECKKCRGDCWWDGFLDCRCRCHNPQNTDCSNGHLRVRNGECLSCGASCQDKKECSTCDHGISLRKQCKDCGSCQDKKQGCKQEDPELKDPEPNDFLDRVWSDLVRYRAQEKEFRKDILDYLELPNLGNRGEHLSYNELCAKQYALRKKYLPKGL